MGTGSKEGLGIVSIPNMLCSDEFVEICSGSDDSRLSDTGGSSSPDLGGREG